MKYLLLLFLTMGCFREPTIEEMMGPDKDGNGVRDDIDEYINDVTKDEDERNVFKQYAKYLRLGFKYYQDKEKSITNTHKMLKAMDCIAEVWIQYHPGWKEGAEYRKIKETIKNDIFSSKKELKIYARINGNFSGQMSMSLGVHESCEFKLRRKYRK